MLSYRGAGIGDVSRPGIKRVILAGGRDPTKWELRGGVFRLLNLAVKGGSQSDYLYLAAYFKSEGEPACRDCLDLTNTLVKQTRAHMLEVQIRKDTWFASMWFPRFFRFEPDDEPIVYRNDMNKVVPPNVEQYYRTPHVTCYWSAGARSCDKYGLVEHLP